VAITWSQVSTVVLHNNTAEEVVDDMGGVVKTPDEAREFVATTDIFWVWT